ncbi:MAG: SMI1/KNR4 family protein, partial [Arenimonas sp.]
MNVSTMVAIGFVFVFMLIVRSLLPRTDALWPIEPPHPPRTLRAEDVAAIEYALGVTLPADYAAFLQCERAPHVDDTTVSDDAATIIEMTL